MSRFTALLKMNVKLLLRNKGFLFFLCITPVVSALILNLKMETTIYENKELKANIVELDQISNRAVYSADTSAYIIKVYDASMTELSDYMLEKFAGAGAFSVCRCDVRGMSEDEVLKQAKKDAFDDRAGTLLYIKTDFETCVLAGDYEGAIQIYSVSDDERWELFEIELKDSLQQIYHVAEYAGMDSGDVLNVLRSIDEKIPEKEVISLTGKGEIALTDQQINQKTNIGYAFAIITLGFLFCGVCVAYTVIEEQNNKVYTRILLSKADRLQYLISKFVMALVISLVQTGLMGICIFAAKNMDFGINKFSFLFVIFCLGLIFSTVSLLVGVLVGEVMSSNYAIFALWSISALLSGLYFSLDAASSAIKAISYLMPQRWFMNAVERLLAGDKGAYSMVIYITAAYLIVTISVGSIGLKMKRSDS